MAGNIKITVTDTPVKNELENEKQQAKEKKLSRPKIANMIARLKLFIKEQTKLIKKIKEGFCVLG